MAISLNPGFLLLLAAAAALVLPAAARGPALALAAIGSISAMFTPAFGEPLALAQIGLVLSPMRLDETSQTFGLAAALVTLLAAVAAFSRRDRLEDVALMLLGGGAVTAAFAGDLATFVAASSAGGLGAGGLLVAGRTPEARAAAVRLLGWQVGAGSLLAIGAGLLWAETGGVRLVPAAAGTPAGLCLLLGFLIGVGAPLAHTWMRDAASLSGPVGGAAIAAIGFIPAQVGLARVFPGLDGLMALGAVMALAPIPIAMADPNWRRALGYASVSLSGAVVAGIGLATPLALAGAASAAFAHAVTILLLGLVLGAAREAVGADRATGPGYALGRERPALAMLAIVGACSLLGAPGTAGYAGRSLLLEAFAREATVSVWLALAAAGAAAVAHVGLKTPLSAFAGPRPPPSSAPATPFPLLLAGALGAFFVMAVGIAPEWLYGLAPAVPSPHDPVTLPRIVAQAQLIAAAALVYLALASTPFAPGLRPADVLDLDWLLRRPLRRGAIALGAALHGAYRGALGGLERWLGAIAAAIASGAAALDRPSRPASSSAALALIAASALVAGALLAASAGTVQR